MKSGVSYNRLEAVTKWALAAIGPADDQECLCLLPGKALIEGAALGPRAQTRSPGRAKRLTERGVVGCTSGQPRMGRRVLRAVGGAGGGGPSRLLPRSKAAISWPGSARNPLP